MKLTIDKTKVVLLGLAFLFFANAGILFAQETPNLPTVSDKFLPYLPSKLPDRVILNLAEDPLTSVNVNWRTSTAQPTGKVEWAEATRNTDFLQGTSTVAAISEFLSVVHDTNPTIEAYYHAATLNGLEAGKTYVYRVGEGEYWSEWFQFSMPNPTADGLSFLYLGDAQNGVRDHWSRLIRQAYRHNPNLDFSIHAGDLINRHNNDFEWGEWFYASSFIRATVPSIMTPGNHEYGKDDLLSPQWRAQFNLPLNGPNGLEETCYQINYPNLKIISLNGQQIFESPELRQKQVEWLDSLLANDPREWTVIIIHQPFYSTKDNRDNVDLRDNFKPLIDKYKIDLVLQGHDHAYGRGTIGPNQNDGIKTDKAEEEGTVYVVAMAGIKMYEPEEYPWMERKAAKTQSYQLIHISNDKKLSYQAYSVEGVLFDEFELHKRADGSNELVNKIPDLAEYK